MRRALQRIKCGCVVSVSAYPCQRRWRAEPGRRCTWCTTSTGSPCSCGGWAAEPPGAPGRPAAAGNRAQSPVSQSVWPVPPCAPAAPHPLDPLLVDADAPEHGFEDLAERQGEEANRAELQSVGHLLQDGACLLLHFVSSLPRLLGHLHNSVINVTD